MNPGILLRGAILLLSLAGLAISLHFTFTYYARIKKARWVPELLCAREGSRCVTVVQTRYAQVFGVPNSLLGVFYYLILIVWCLALTLDHNPSPGEGRLLTYPDFQALLLLASASTVVLGGYLIYALRRKLGTHCALCYTAHAINTILFVLLIFV